MPRRRRSIGTSRGRSSATLKPETRTSPLVTGSSAYTSLRTVDLPAPEWPVRNTNSPFPVWNVTSFRASPPLGKGLKTFVNLITYCCARACAKSAMMSSASSSPRSEEHTSELQSQSNLVCRLLLEKKHTNPIRHWRDPEGPDYQYI